MSILLDTHAFLWWITDDKRLSVRARKVLLEPENTLFLSAASSWEIAIKVQLGRLIFRQKLEDFLPDQLLQNGIEFLPIRLDHTLRVATLPDVHKDPFDRLLIAQAQLDDFSILTRDENICRYRVKTIW